MTCHGIEDALMDVTVLVILQARMTTDVGQEPTTNTLMSLLASLVVLVRTIHGSWATVLVKIASSILVLQVTTFMQDAILQLSFMF